MSFRRRTKHLPDPQHHCRCGQAMARTWRSNSGTTHISQACPTILTTTGRDDHPSYGPAGHQFVVVSNPEHDPNCCSIRHIGTAGWHGDPPDPYWTGRHPGAPLDHTAHRALLDVAAGHITVSEALMRVALTAGINGDHRVGTVEDAVLAALDETRLPETEPHHCPTPHRTAPQVAKCATGGVVAGVGTLAVVSECFPWRKVRIAMYPTVGQATAALLRLDDYGCGDYCRGDHYLARWPRNSTPPPAAPAAPTADTSPPTLDLQETHTVATTTHPDSLIGDLCRECAARKACSHRGLCWDCLTVGSDQVWRLPERPK